MCDMTHSCVLWLVHMWHDSYVTCFIHMWHVILITRTAMPMDHAERPLMSDMTHAYVTWLIHASHDSFICNMAHPYVTRHTHHTYCSGAGHDDVERPIICDMTNYMWHDQIYVTWPIICDMTNYMWHDQFTLDMHIWHGKCVMSHAYVTWLNHDSYVTLLLYMWHDSYTRECTYAAHILPKQRKCRCSAPIHAGWPRLIGSPKLQIIFHKRATKYRSRLRKMTYEDKGSYESSPPCMWGLIHTWHNALWQFPLRILHPRNPPYQESFRFLGISWHKFTHSLNVTFSQCECSTFTQCLAGTHSHLAEHIHIEMSVSFQVVSRNSGFWIWWISGVQQFQCNLSYVITNI